ncbi:MAG: Mth938-like domain-containing protein [Thiohalobacteraceae bacterium]
MRFAEDDNTGQFQIRAYGIGQIQVNEEVFTQSLVLSAETLLRDWPPQRFEDLSAEHLQAAVELDPEILILGTGAQIRFPHPGVTADLQARGIGVEIMDTAAACRTFNVLVGERRRVAAALLMI